MGKNIGHFYMETDGSCIVVSDTNTPWKQFLCNTHIFVLLTATYSSATHRKEALLLFHSDNGYENALQYYVVRHCLYCWSLSSVQFPGVWILYADVSEHSVFHLHRRVGMKILHTYPPLKMEHCSERSAYVSEHSVFHLHRRVGMKILHTYPRMKMEQSVPKRRHIKFRRRRITQKKAYNVQDTAKVWNQGLSILFIVRPGGKYTLTTRL